MDSKTYLVYVQNIGDYIKYVEWICSMATSHDDIQNDRPVNETLVMIKRFLFDLQQNLLVFAKLGVLFCPMNVKKSSSSMTGNKHGCLIS